MTDTFRYRHEADHVMAPVDSAVAIEVGDLVYWDVDDAKPASSQADKGSEAANQSLFAQNFLGVAQQRSRSGDTDPIRVKTEGVFEFACPSGTFELGQMVGVDENAAGNGLLDQTVAAVTLGGLAIGRVARRQASAVTTVLVKITSAIMSGGVAGTSSS